MKNLILTGILAFSGATAQAAAASHWQGTGTMYDQNRIQLSTYTLDVVAQPGDDGAEKVVVTITGGNAVVFHQTCTQQSAGDKWSKTCDDGGHGGGYLFDYGLGSDYYQAADGTAYATTIILDGDAKMRLERTALKNGVATRFFAEQLTKAAN